MPIKIILIFSLEINISLLIYRYTNSFFKNNFKLLIYRDATVSSCRRPAVITFNWLVVTGMLPANHR